jgi:hypothetical protein
VSDAKRRRSLEDENGRLKRMLADAEQVEATGQARARRRLRPNASRAARRRTNRGALSARLPQIETLVDVASTTAPAASARFIGSARTSRTQ